MNKKELVGKLPLFINCGRKKKLTDKKLDMLAEVIRQAIIKQQQDKLITALVDAINRKHFGKLPLFTNKELDKLATIVKKYANLGLSDSIIQKGWSEFIRQIKYKSEQWNGTYFGQIDRLFPSSKISKKAIKKPIKASGKPAKAIRIDSSIQSTLK